MSKGRFNSYYNVLIHSIEFFLRRGVYLAGLIVVQALLKIGYRFAVVALFQVGLG